MSALPGKCVLITGSTQGLGLAAARRFAKAGCHIVLNGFAAPEEIAAMRREIETLGVRALYCGADLRNPAEIEQMISNCESAFGGVDVLINNAVVRHTAAVEEFPVEKWEEALAVNLSAAFHTIRLALPAMRRKNWGRIINISSIYGLRGAPNRAGYITTKTALLGLTRAVAMETLGQNITCNAVCPGTTLTPPHETAIRETIAAEGISRADAEQRFLSGKQPSGRFIQSEDVVALMLFLCQAESREITGAALPVDGGWTSS